MLTIGHRLLNTTLVAALLLAAAPAFVQQASAGEGIGVVTAIQGQATVARQALPQPAALRFKDDVFFRDQIATREHATVRLLLGGKGTLMIREQSQVTLDESVAPDGGRRSVLGLIAGKIGAAIAHPLMRPGESVEIQTPNAVAAVRGTVLIAEYIPPQGSAANRQPVLLASAAPGPFLAQAPGGAGGTSNFFVLSGQVTITPQGQPSLTLGPLQGVSIMMTPAGAGVGAVQNLTPDQVAQAAQGLEAGKPHTGEAESSKTAQAQAQVAAALANIILQATTGGTPSTPNAPTNTVAPVVPVVPQPVTVGENVLPSGAILALHDNVAVQMGSGASFVTFRSGSANTILPLDIAGPGTVLLTDPLLSATGDPITHTGAIVTLRPGDSPYPTSILADSSSANAPLVQVQATNLTNTGGSIFDLSESVLTGYGGPILSLKEGGTATLAGLVTADSASEVSLGSGNGIEVPSGTSLTATSPLYNLTGGSILTSSGGHLVFADPSTFTLNAPILSATDSIVTLEGAVLRAVDSTITGTQPLVLLQSGSALGSLGGPVLDLTNSTLDLGSQPVVKLLGGSTFATKVGPIIRVSGGSLTADALGVTDGAENTWDLTGTILDLTNTTVHLRVMGTEPSGGADTFTHTLAAGEPAVRMTNSNLTLTGAGEPLWHFDADSDGVALIATNDSGTTKTISLAGPLLSLQDVNLTATDPYIQLSNMTVSQTGSDALISVEAPPSSAKGPLLAATNSDFILNGSAFLKVLSGGSLTVSGTTAPLISLSGGSMTVGAGVSAIVLDNATANISGPFFKASNVAFPGTPGVPFMTLNAASLTTGGPFLDLINTDLNIGNQPLVSLSGASTFANTAGPVIRVSGGSLTADALGSSDGAENTWDLTGTILDLTNTTVHLRVMGTEPSGGATAFTHTLAAGKPAISMTNSNLTLTGAGESLVHFDADSDGVALIATNTSGTQKTISLAGPLLDLDTNSIDIDLSSTDPLATLSEMTVQQTGTNGLIEVRGGSVTVHAPLLQMTNTSPTGLNTVAGSLLKILNQGQLVADVSDSLIKITGGTHAIGSATGSGSGSILDIIGGNDCDGPCQALYWGGTILEAKNATIDLSGSGNAIRVDTAKVDTATADATKPIINLINSTLNTSTSGDSETGAIYLYNSRVTSYGPVFGLDNSTLTVRNGPALSLTGGTSMTVNTDFATLINGSKITVQNGPLIYVDGSSLTVTGALVNFGGTGRNQLIVNNSITPTGTTNGVPFRTETGGIVNIYTSTPIKNLETKGTVSFTGSVIKATNYGYVTIGGGY